MHINVLRMPGVLVQRSVATSALGRSAAVRERRSLRGAAQRSSGDDYVGLSTTKPARLFPGRVSSTSSQDEATSSRQAIRRDRKVFSFVGGFFSSAGLLCIPFPSWPWQVGREKGQAFMPLLSQIVALCHGATLFFGFLPGGPTSSLDATDHRLG